MDPPLLGINDRADLQLKASTSSAKPAPQKFAVFEAAKLPYPKIFRWHCFDKPLSIPMRSWQISTYANFLFQSDTIAYFEHRVMSDTIIGAKRRQGQTNKAKKKNIDTICPYQSVEKHLFLQNCRILREKLWLNLLIFRKIKTEFSIESQEDCFFQRTAILISLLYFSFCLLASGKRPVLFIRAKDLV